MAFITICDFFFLIDSLSCYPVGSWEKRFSFILFTLQVLEQCLAHCNYCYIIQPKIRWLKTTVHSNLTILWADWAWLGGSSLGIFCVVGVNSILAWVTWKIRLTPGARCRPRVQLGLWSRVPTRDMTSPRTLGVTSTTAFKKYLVGGAGVEGREGRW